MQPPPAGVTIPCGSECDETMVTSPLGSGASEGHGMWTPETLVPRPFAPALAQTPVALVAVQLTRPLLLTAQGYLSFDAPARGSTCAGRGVGKKDRITDETTFPDFPNSFLFGTGSTQ